MTLIQTHEFQVGSEYIDTLERVWFERQALINIMKLEMTDMLANKFADRLQTAELTYLITWDQILRECCDTCMNTISLHYSHPSYSCIFGEGKVYIHEYRCPKEEHQVDSEG